MDVFEKCLKINEVTEGLKANGAYFFFRRIDSPQDSEVFVSGKRVIMAGSNNYLGLTSHPRVKEAAIRAISADFNQYAITWGTPPLRKAITDKFTWYNGVSYDPEKEVTVCCGSTEAMIASLMAIVNPGEEVIVFEPFYENYGPDAKIGRAHL